MNDSLRNDLIRLSREINADPELAYKEERAVGRITALLQKHGHEVERNLRASDRVPRAGRSAGSGRRAPR